MGSDEVNEEGRSVGARCQKICSRSGNDSRNPDQSRSEAHDSRCVTLWLSQAKCFWIQEPWRIRPKIHKGPLRSKFGSRSKDFLIGLLHRTRLLCRETIALHQSPQMIFCSEQLRINKHNEYFDFTCQRVKKTNRYQTCSVPRK